MRFIVDASLSPAVADGLRQAEHEAVHVVEYKMLQASDADILDRGLREDRIVISADTDFAMLLATRNEARPSLILFRHPMRRPEGQIGQLLGAIQAAGEPLAEGAVVVIEESRLRIRLLPIGESRAD